MLQQRGVRMWDRPGSWAGWAAGGDTRVKASSHWISFTDPGLWPPCVTNHHQSLLPPGHDTLYSLPALYRHSLDNCRQHNSGPSQVTLLLLTLTLVCWMSVPLISDLWEATMIYIIVDTFGFSSVLHVTLTELVSFDSIWKELWSKSKVFTYFKDCFVYHLLIYNKNCKVLIWNQIIKMLYDSTIPNIWDPLTSL